jgi:hypothetical protein
MHTSYSHQHLYAVWNTLISPICMWYHFYSPILYVRVMLLNIHVTRIVTRILIMIWCMIKLTKYNTRILHIYSPNNITRIYVIPIINITKIFIFLLSISNTRIYVFLLIIINTRIHIFYSSLSTPEFIYFTNHYSTSLQ